MSFPWDLFGLTPRDVSGPLVRAHSEFRTFTGVGASPLLSWNLSNDSATFINCLSWEALGANAPAETCRYVEVSLVIGNQIYAFLTVPAQHTAATALGGTDPANAGWLSGSPALIARAGSTLNMQFFFNGGLANHTITGSWSGFEIPRGTLAYV